MGAVTLVVDKEEELLLEDGSGEIDAKLIQFQGHFRARREVIPGIESVVAQEFKNSAMKVIGSGLGDDIHLRPERETALRAVAAIGEVDLLDTIKACASDARAFLAFGLEEAIDIAAIRGLAIEFNIQTGKDVIEPVDAALEKCRGAD